MFKVVVVINIQQIEASKSHTLTYKTKETEKKQNDGPYEDFLPMVQNTPCPYKAQTLFIASKNFLTRPI